MYICLLTNSMTTCRPASVLLLIYAPYLLPSCAPAALSQYLPLPSLSSKTPAAHLACCRTAPLSFIYCRPSANTQALPASAFCRPSLPQPSAGPLCLHLLQALSASAYCRPSLPPPTASRLRLMQPPPCPRLLQARLRLLQAPLRL